MATSKEIDLGPSILGKKKTLKSSVEIPKLGAQRMNATAPKAQTTAHTSQPRKSQKSASGVPFASESEPEDSDEQPFVPGQKRRHAGQRGSHGGVKKRAKSDKRVSFTDSLDDGGNAPGNNMPPPSTTDHGRPSISSILRRRDTITGTPASPSVSVAGDGDTAPSTSRAATATTPQSGDADMGASISHVTGTGPSTSPHNSDGIPAISQPEDANSGDAVLDGADSNPPPTSRSSSSTTAKPRSGDGGALSFREYLYLGELKKQGVKITPDTPTVPNKVAKPKKSKTTDPVKLRERVDRQHKRIRDLTSTNQHLVRENKRLEDIIKNGEHSDKKVLQLESFQVAMVVTSLVKDIKEIFGLTDKVKVLKQKGPGHEVRAKMLSDRIPLVRRRLTDAVGYKRKAAEAEATVETDDEEAEEDTEPNGGKEVIEIHDDDGEGAEDDEGDDEE